jgi:nucleoside-diphosphate-sugar epimerase
MASLFLTGASGFVGRTLLGTLSSNAFESVTCLTRDPVHLARAVPPRPNWSYARGDLTAPAAWERRPAAGDVVLHLAAATGKEPAARFRAVNSEGTATLVAECRKAGIGRLILVSSIATRFADRRYYPYATTKLEAEDLVRQSGLEFAIVRPTMVFGAGSPVLAGLAKMARGPVALVFGSGKVRVQPIAARDLARVVFAIATRPTLAGAEIDVGGPDILTMEELIRRIRSVFRGRPGPLVHLPLGMVRFTLNLLEPLLLPVLPLSAGQLASFANDGVAVPHPWVLPLLPSMQSVDAMLREAASGG